jgi:hypothetical protein
MNEFVRDSHANWEMLESSLLIEKMVGATTPDLVILISNLPQKENCKLSGLCEKFSDLWMSIDSKVAPSHYNSDCPRWSIVI